MKTPIEVYRMSDHEFDTNKYYSFALYSQEIGSFPNCKYYTYNELLYCGRYVRTNSWGFNDGRTSTYYFIKDDGTETKIDLDYKGRTCFIEVDPGEIILK